MRRLRTRRQGGSSVDRGDTGANFVFAHQPQLLAVDGTEVPFPFDPSHVDQAAFGNGEPLAVGLDFASRSRYRAWFLRNPASFTYLLADGQLVGYINAMPLVDEAFQAVLEGRCNDGQIDPASIRAYDEPGAYRVYLSTIAVMPSFRRLSAFWLLLLVFRKKAESLRERGLIVTELASVVWSDEGRQICRALGMQHRGPHTRRGEVFHGHLKDGRLPEALPRAFVQRQGARPAMAGSYVLSASP